MDTQGIRQVFDKAGPFAILVGDSYGIDEMGSALALYLTLKSLGKDAAVISTRQPNVEVSSLVGIDRVRPEFTGEGGDLIVSFPYQGDEIGKVSYTLENGLLNIIVKPKEGAGLSFGEKDVLFRRSGSIPSVLVTVGVKRLSEIQKLFRVEDLKDTTIVNIDKSGNNEGFGDVVVIGQGASSVAEQVANVLLSAGYPLDPDISQNLMSGIISATGNFQSPRTSSLAFEMAGILLRNGARRESLKTERSDFRDPRSFGQARPTRPFGQRGQNQNQQFGRGQDQPQTQNQPGMQSFGQRVQGAARQTTEFTREQRKTDQGLSEDTPPDWLAPKIYKGSTNVE